MGLGEFRWSPDYGEHEVLSEILDEIFEEEIPDGYSWSKTRTRGKKWVKMARAYLFRPEETPRDRFNQAANEVGEELGDGGVCAETVKSALRRETFGDGVSIEVPREVLREVEKRVLAREDVSLEEILRVHRENSAV